MERIQSEPPYLITGAFVRKIIRTHYNNNKYNEDQATKDTG